MQHPPAPHEPARRRVVLVLGPAGSGADLLARSLGALGAGLPDPTWLAELGVELFARSSVVDGDARPAAWFAAGRLSQYERLRIRASTWLEEQLAAQHDVPEGVRIVPEVVLADPRLAWYAGMWRSAAVRCGASPSFALALRPGAELVATAVDPTGADTHAATRATAAWLNLVLHTERATRGSARVVVRRADLLDDWTQPLYRLGRALDLAAVQEATANTQRAVHTLLEPARSAAVARAAAGHVAPTWADLDLPPRLREIAEATDAALDALVEDPEDDAVTDRLDALRADYTALHDEAAALTESGVRAAHAAGVLAAHEAAGHPVPWLPVVGRTDLPGTVDPGPGGAPAPAAGAGRVAERVPHRVRALVPPGVRRGLRRAVGRARAGREA